VSCQLACAGRLCGAALSIAAVQHHPIRPLSNGSRRLGKWGRVSGRAAPKRHTLVKPRSADPLFFCCCCCYAATQLAIQAQQGRTQVVCSNREARKRPAESNGIPVMDRDLGHMNVVLKWCMCMSVVDLGFGMIIIIVLIVINVFSFLFLTSFVSVFFLSFLEFIKCECGLKWMWCGGGVVCSVECMNVVKKWHGSDCHGDNWGYQGRRGWFF